MINVPAVAERALMLMVFNLFPKMDTVILYPGIGFAQHVFSAIVKIVYYFVVMDGMLSIFQESLFEQQRRKIIEVVPPYRPGVPTGIFVIPMFNVKFVQLAQHNLAVFI